MIIVTSASHADHGLTPEQMAYILESLNSGTATVVVGPFGPFFIATVTLPAALGTAPCALHGPATGGQPVPESEVTYQRRGARPNVSRLCDRPPTRSNVVTAIVIGNEGPEGGQRIDTAFGGPLAPREQGDPDLVDPAEQAASAAFWAEHALSK